MFMRLATGQSMQQARLRTAVIARAGLTMCICNGAYTAPPPGNISPLIYILMSPVPYLYLRLRFTINIYYSHPKITCHCNFGEVTLRARGEELTKSDLTKGAITASGQLHPLANLNLLIPAVSLSMNTLTAV